MRWHGLLDDGPQEDIAVELRRVEAISGS